LVWRRVLAPSPAWSTNLGDDAHVVATSIHARPTSVVKSTDQAWRHYCANALLLDSLGELWWLREIL
jgi:hypothetical protein